ncbi:hypothetical protein HK105_202511 [Polyrhizophydium stewartii]|uniref:Uncharacterized protein n=1 Tax=Polyrhizophydium stewartii TaxID=2732419 RepID=A0ABR4NEY9_9FUNG
MTPEQREQRLLHMREYHPQAIPRPHEAGAGRLCGHAGSPTELVEFRRREAAGEDPMRKRDLDPQIFLVTFTPMIERVFAQNTFHTNFTVMVEATPTPGTAGRAAPDAAALDESQFVAQIHGVERRLILVLQLASQAISMLDQPEQDLEEFKTGFEQKCVALGEVVTEIQSGLKALLQRFAATGVLDAAGQQLQYNITTAGEEKDLEILTNGVALLRDLLAQHSASAGAARPDGDAEMAL